ncbi:MAG: hypothetical protein GVY36_10840 [Verrucomicrobia bacterium]|jgi:hypothetical protein|nr:hypothetical protein [Verrucomicrobiota bacterium]
MGCDIHPYICRWTEDEGFENFSYEQLDFARNYVIFGLMAGIRGNEQLFEPRGLPDDLPSAVQFAFEYNRDDWHTPSWLKIDELREVRDVYVRHMEKSGKRRGYPGQHLAGIIGMMDSAEQWWNQHFGGGDAILVFWFDN